MKVALLGLAVVVASGLASGRAHASSGEEPAAAAATSGVEVKVEDSFTDVETTRRWVEERAARALEELEPKLAAEDLVRIVVKGGAFEYRVSLVLLRRGKPLAAEQQPSEIACACSSDEMLETVATAIEAGARTLAEAAKREREEEEAAAAAAERQRQEDERKRQEDERKRQDAARTARYRSSSLGRAGVGIAGVGGLVVITGAIVSAQGKQSMSNSYSLARDYSSSGYALIGVGSGVVTGGLTMLIIDVVRCRRSPNRCGTPATAWASPDPRLTSKPARGSW